jgi:hypothetical protein
MRARARPVLVPLAFLTLLLPILAVPADARASRCLGEVATRVGTPGDDVLRGTSGVDVFVGRGGDDRLIGRGGNDLICAGGGDDAVKAGGGDDAVIGGGGNDVLDGGPGVDDLNGGPGVDECTAGESASGCESPELDLDGAWAGLTSQSREVAFQVEDHALVRFELAYAWSGSGCTVEGEVTIDYATPLPIEDDAFLVDSTMGTFTLQVPGAFSSETQADGTFTVGDSGGSCPGGATGTWSAAKA